MSDESVNYLIDNRKYSGYTTIKADYLMEYLLKKDNSIFYLFTVKESKNPKFDNECKGCSFFKKHNINYTYGTSKTTTLYIKKLYNAGTENESEEFLYKNPSYIENQSDQQR